jgi:hypothetical protein
MDSMGMVLNRKSTFFNHLIFLFFLIIVLNRSTMRLGKDVILFTKKDNIQTAFLLSRTFLEEQLITDGTVSILN